MSKKTIAFFDFDGTLTKGDTLLPFLKSVRGSSKLVNDLIFTSPLLLGYAAHIIKNDVAKVALINRCLVGMHIDELRAFGIRFAADRIPNMLRSDMMLRLQQHQDAGHECVLVTASLDIYIEPWATTNRFNKVISSSLNINEYGQVLGGLLGENCYGIEKVRQIKNNYSNQLNNSETYAYGNSNGDVGMLNIADNPYWVKKGITPYIKKINSS